MPVWHDSAISIAGLRVHPDGSGIEIYARGLRNSVGLAWHPVTGELWFVEGVD